MPPEVPQPKLKNWTEADIKDLFQYDDQLFQRAKATLKGLLKKAFPHGADFKKNEDIVARDRMILQFGELEDGIFVSPARYTESNPPPENFNDLAQKALANWFITNNKVLRRDVTTTTSKGRSKTPARPAKDSQTTSAASDSDTESYKKQKLDHRRGSGSSITTGLASPMLGLGIHSTQSPSGPSMRMNQTVLLSFLVQDLTRKQTIRIFPDNVRSEHAMMKPSSELQVEDLSFDEFVQRCEEELSFDIFQHMLFWKLFNLNGTFEVLSANDPANWRIAIQQQSVHRVVSFAFSYISVVQNSIERTRMQTGYVDMSLDDFEERMSTRGDSDTVSDTGRKSNDFERDSQPGGSDIASESGRKSDDSDEDLQKVIEASINTITPPESGQGDGTGLEQFHQQQSDNTEPSGGTGGEQAKGTRIDRVSSSSTLLKTHASTNSNLQIEEQQFLSGIADSKAQEQFLASNPRARAAAITVGHAKLRLFQRLNKKMQDDFLELEEAQREEVLERVEQIEELSDHCSFMTIPQLGFKTQQPIQAKLRKALNLKNEVLNHMFSHGGGVGSQLESDVALADNDMLTEEDLEKMLENNVSTQFDEQTVADLCRFLRIRLKCFKVRDASFQLSGTRRYVYPYQLYAAWWAWKQMHSPTFSARGVFIADGVGFGKTTEALTLLFLQASLNAAFQDVELARARQLDEIELVDGPHRDPDQQDDSKCRANQRRIHWLPCPCSFVTGSIGQRYGFKKSEGPALIVVPPVLMPNWMDEAISYAKTGVGEKDRIQVFIAYQHKMSSEQWSWYESRGIRLFTDQTVRRLAVDGTTKQPKPNSSRCWVITTPLSAQNQIFERVKKAGVQINWSIVVMDEFHLHKGEDTIIQTKFRSGQLGDPFYLFLSATPMEKDTRDLLGPLQAIQSKFLSFGQQGNAKGATGWRPNTPNEVKQELGAIYPVNVRENGKELDTIRRRVIITEATLASEDRLMGIVADTRALVSKLMIKRNPTSTWYGQLCLDLPLLRMFDVGLSAPTQYKDQLEKVYAISKRRMIAKLNMQRAAWEKKWSTKPPALRPPKPTHPTAQHFTDAGLLARVASDFPFFATIMNENDGKDEWGAPMGSKLYDHRGKHWLWVKYREQIITTSPKLSALKTAIKKMREHLDFVGDTRKGMIFGFNSMVCGIYYLFITEVIGESASWISADTPIEDRANIVKDYQQDGNRGPLWLIGTPDILGVGLTCAKGSVTFMMEPQFTLKQEWQAYGRQNRTSLVQKEPATFAYRFYTVGNPVEEVIMRRQVDRNAIQVMSFKDDENIGDDEEDDFELGPNDVA